MKGENITVSVIIPIYNMADSLAKCLNNIVSQTLEHMEIICIDDGSTDESSSILRKYELKFQNLVVIHTSNQGAGPARNLGIANAHGKYLAFMDADDLYPSIRTLKSLYDAAEEMKAEICGGNLIVSVEGKTDIYRESMFCKNQWIKSNSMDCFWYQRFLYRTDMIREAQIAFPSYRRFQDPPFMIAAMAYAKRVYALPDAVYIYKVHDIEPHFSKEKAVDLLRGIRDCFLIAKRNDYLHLYHFRLCFLLEKYFPAYCRYAYMGCEEVWRLLEEVYGIEADWVGMVFRSRWTHRSLVKYVNYYKGEYLKLKEIFTSSFPIVIYGAGQTGKKILHTFFNEKSNIIGFAVTKQLGESLVEGIPVRTIEEYFFWKNTAYVILAIADREQREWVQDKLKKDGFIYRFYFPVEKMEWIESMVCV